MSTRCYLVRHAQTLWNGENRLQGGTDMPLSPLGLKQAACLAARFAKQPVRGIVTSGLRRSRQTAETIASGLPAPACSASPSAAAGAQAGNGHAVTPLVDPELGEMHLGEWEGLTPEEIDARFQQAYQQWRRQPSSVDIPGGEPLAAFRQRVRRAFDRALAGFGEGEYVVVTHGGVIAALLADWLSADYDTLIRRLRLDNAGITALELGSPLPHVLWVNSTRHLESLEQPPRVGWY
jgi:broad specificity phosphatase PhoE